MLHDIGRSLGDVEAAHEVDVDGGLKKRQRHGSFPAQYATGSDDTGTVHGYVQSAIGLGCCFHGSDDAFFRCDIGTDVARAELCLGRSTGFVIDIQQHGLAAVCNDVAGYAQAESGYAAGDERFNLVQLHDCCSFLCYW